MVYTNTMRLLFMFLFLANAVAGELDTSPLRACSSGTGVKCMSSYSRWQAEVPSHLLENAYYKQAPV